MASSNHRDDFVVIQTVFRPHWAVADNLCSESELYNYYMQPTETKKIQTIRNRSFPATQQAETADAAYVNWNKQIITA